MIFIHSHRKIKTARSSRNSLKTDATEYAEIQMTKWRRLTSQVQGWGLGTPFHLRFLLSSRASFTILGINVGPCFILLLSWTTETKGTSQDHVITGAKLYLGAMLPGELVYPFLITTSKNMISVNHTSDWSTQSLKVDQRIVVEILLLNKRIADLLKENDSFRSKCIILFKLCQIQSSFWLLGWCRPAGKKNCRTSATKSTTNLRTGCLRSKLASDQDYLW